MTPFTPDDQIDVDGLTFQTERLVRSGVGGIVACGSTGEFTSLTTAERRLVTETVFAAAKGRVPIVAQVGSTRMNEALELVDHAGDLEVAAVMAVPPFYEPLSWPEVRNYYKLLAEHSRVPVMLYHIPGATGQKFTVDEIQELSEIKGVKFMKDSSSDSDLLVQLIRKFADRSDFTVFNGWDSLNLTALLEGAKGTVWGMANFLPDLCVEFYIAASNRHEVDIARTLWNRLLPLVMFCESHTYVATVKAACSLVGLNLGEPRLPIMPIRPVDRVELRRLLESAHVPVEPAPRARLSN